MPIMKHAVVGDELTQEGYELAVHEVEPWASTRPVQEWYLLTFDGTNVGLLYLSKVLPSNLPLIFVSYSDARDTDDAAYHIPYFQLLTPDTGALDATEWDRVSEVFLSAKSFNAVHYGNFWDIGDPDSYDLGVPIWGMSNVSDPDNRPTVSTVFSDQQLSPFNPDSYASYSVDVYMVNFEAAAGVAAISCRLRWIDPDGANAFTNSEEFVETFSAADFLPDDYDAPAVPFFGSEHNQVICKTLVPSVTPPLLTAYGTVPNTRLIELTIYREPYLDTEGSAWDTMDAPVGFLGAVVRGVRA